MDNGNKTQAVASVEGMAAEEVGGKEGEVMAVVGEEADFGVSSPRRRSQRVGRGKPRIPPVISASAYPVYNSPGHPLPAA